MPTPWSPTAGWAPATGTANPRGLDKRISIRDFDEVRDGAAMGDHDVGRRDRSDPSYTVLKDPF